MTRFKMIVLNGEIKMSIPEDIKESIDLHVKHGNGYVGSFVQAVLENNLKEAFGKADENNREALFEIVSYCYNKIPAGCWGSKENVEAWQGELR